MSDPDSGASCAAVVLAAGASTRLGQPKQLLRVNSESLLHRVVRLATEAGCAPTFVVLGFDAERMQQELDNSGVKIVFNPDWQSGMGSSLRCGMSAVMKENPLPQKALLLLCDQAKLSAVFLSRLIQGSKERDSRITASSYAGRFGVPAIFDKQFYPELLQIEGDQGARALIQQYQKQATMVDFPEGTVDIDTPEDLATLRAISPE